MARALLRQGYDRTALRQGLDSDVHQSIKIREPREDERVRERCPGSGSAAWSKAQADLFGRASPDAVSFARKSDDCHASYCAADMPLIRRARNRLCQSPQAEMLKAALFR